ncbi:hypothetical protein GCM10028818_06360 [Spirosoma horti]
MKKHNGMRPQDIPVLLKISAQYNRSWSEFNPSDKIRILPKSGRDLLNKDIAAQLRISPSEVTESLARSAFAGLYDPESKRVMSRALFEFLEYGLKYVFPQQPGALTRGTPTAHSAKPLSALIQASEHYVWPSADGTVRGQAIEPLYPTIVQAVENDSLLYEMLALIDAIRVGKAREVKLAVDELRQRLLITE